MKKSDLVLTALIFVGLIAGVIVGQFFLFDEVATQQAISETVGPWQEAGELLFFRPLQLMILPIVFVSVVAGVSSIGDPQKLGVLGLSTLAYYVSTMMLAIGLGLVLVSAIAPGKNLTEESRQALVSEANELPAVVAQMSERYEQGNEDADAPDASIGTILLDLGKRLVPTNPFRAATQGNTLGVIFFSILLGLALVSVGEAGRPVIEVFNGLFDALIKLVQWIIWIAPLGVFLLVSAKIGSVGLGAIAGPIGGYMLVVVLGLLIHALVTLPGVLFLLVRINPFRYLWNLRKPLIFAFSTASSGATMPVTIEECQKSGDCSEQATNFVIPLGATVNMDGTALYQGVAVVFLFQLYGIDLGIGELLVILLTATFAAVGTAAVPSAGLITMAIVIVAVNTSLVGLGREDAVLPLSAIGVILGIDRVLDMCRTSVNVWGDAIGARIMTRLAPDEEREREEALS